MLIATVARRNFDGGGSRGWGAGAVSFQETNSGKLGKQHEHTCECCHTPSTTTTTTIMENTTTGTETTTITENTTTITIIMERVAIGW